MENKLFAMVTNEKVYNRTFHSKAEVTDFNMINYTKIGICSKRMPQ